MSGAAPHRSSLNLWASPSVTTMEHKWVPLLSREVAFQEAPISDGSPARSGRPSHYRWTWFPSLPLTVTLMREDYSVVHHATCCCSHSRNMRVVALTLVGLPLPPLGQRGKAYRTDKSCQLGKGGKAWVCEGMAPHHWSPWQSFSWI